ncbi:MAG: 4Fe-4S binding protein [Coriobacteriales bacterium]|jgi:NAD-dependent dihydropyrimidine dehydrogenase PreA subunit
MAVQIKKDDCVGCGACVDTCPASALELGPDNVVEVSEADCVECGACVDTCPNGALEL